VDRAGRAAAEDTGGSTGLLAVGRAAARADTTAPDGSEIRLLATAAHGATRASLVEVRLAPDATSRPVCHRSVEEAWYVLEGSGQVWRAPAGASVDPVSVAAGDALVIPTGWRFQFRAAATGLRFLCFTVPAWPGPDEAQPAGEGPLGPPTV
jgi:mannose-6-phosphate isomerase-like protein (cupin superfamily)